MFSLLLLPKSTRLSLAACLRALTAVQEIKSIVISRESPTQSTVGVSSKLNMSFPYWVSFVI